MYRHDPLMRPLLSQFQTPTAPRRAVGFFRSGRLAPSCWSQPFALCTGRELLRSRHLAPSAIHRLLCGLHSVPCAAHGYLRAQHFALCARRGYLHALHSTLAPPRTSPPAALDACFLHGLLRALRLTFRVESGFLRPQPFPPPRRLRIAPHSPRVLLTDCSVLNT